MTTLAPAQHLAALELANQARANNSTIKHEIEDGKLTAADALYDPRAASLTVSALMRAQHDWGHGRTRRRLAQLGHGPHGVTIRETKRVGKLTDRQRDTLARSLR